MRKRELRKRIEQLETANAALRGRVALLEMRQPTTNPAPLQMPSPWLPERPYPWWETHPPIITCTNEQQHYEFVPLNLISGVSYYRKDADSDEYRPVH